MYFEEYFGGSYVNASDCGAQRACDGSWSSDSIPSVFDRKLSLAVAADALVDDGPHLPGGYSLHEEVNTVCILTSVVKGEGTRKTAFISPLTTQNADGVGSAFPCRQQRGRHPKYSKKPNSSVEVVFGGVKMTVEFSFTSIRYLSFTNLTVLC